MFCQPKKFDSTVRRKKILSKNERRFPSFNFESSLFPYRHSFLIKGRFSIFHISRRGRLFRENFSFFPKRRLLHFPPRSSFPGECHRSSETVQKKFVQFQITATLINHFQHLMPGNCVPRPYIPYMEDTFSN